MKTNILDDFAAFNRFQVMEGMRVNEGGIKPSVYITEVKFKKLFRLLSLDELKRALNIKDKSSKVAKERYTNALIAKLEKISESRLFTALNIYMRHEDAELAAKYIWACPIDVRRPDNKD